MNSKLLISAVAAVAAVAAFYFLALAPKREEVARLDTEIATQEAAAAQSELLAAAYAKAKGNYRTNYTTIARLGKAVPADDDIRSLLIQLDSVASESDVSFRALTLSGGGAVPEGDDTAESGDLAPAPGSVPVGSAGFSAMPFSFSFDGSYFDLSDFFRRMENFVSVENKKIDVTGRLLLLGSISVTPEAGDLRKLQAQINAATYLVPPTEGVTDGASPQAPAGTTPSTSEPAGGENVPNTTATITGVR